MAFVDRRLVAIALAALVSGACASSGAMTGRLSGADGPPRPVAFDYQADRTGDRGTMSVTLPGGEAFNGSFARVRAGSAAAPGSDLDFAEIDWGHTADRWVFGGADSDKVVALLQGNQGRKIRCRFTLRSPAGGLGDGGTGECQVSTGERIDVRF